MGCMVVLIHFYEQVHRSAVHESVAASRATPFAAGPRAALSKVQQKISEFLAPFCVSLSKSDLKRGKMKATEAFLIGQIVVFGAVLPTVDTFSDLFLCGKLFQSGHSLWAIAIILPVIINFFFIVVAFRQFPFPPWHHRYVSAAMLVLQVES